MRPDEVVDMRRSLGFLAGWGHGPTYTEQISISISGRSWYAWPFRSCYAGVPVGFQFKNREYSSHWFHITLETYALFLPACKPKGMQMDHFALDNLKAARMPRKGWRLSDRVDTSRIQRISLPRSSSSVLSLSTLPVMLDAIPDNFNGGHLSSSGDFSFAIIFSIDFFACNSCKRWPSRWWHNQHRMVDGSKLTRQDQSTQNLLKWPEKLEPLIVSGYPRGDFFR